MGSEMCIRDRIKRFKKTFYDSDRGLVALVGLWWRSGTHGCSIVGLTVCRVWLVGGARGTTGWPVATNKTLQGPWALPPRRHGVEHGPVDRREGVGGGRGEKLLALHYSILIFLVVKCKVERYVELRRDLLDKRRARGDETRRET